MKELQIPGVKFRTRKKTSKFYLYRFCSRNWLRTLLWLCRVTLIGVIHRLIEYLSVKFKKEKKTKVSMLASIIDFFNFILFH